MAPSRSSKPARTSLKDELSELLGTGTKPKDFDPEAIDQSDDDDRSNSGSDEGSSSDGEADTKGREHYVAVGKSKLRARIDQQAGPEALGKQYVGKKVRRDDVFASDGEEDDNSEDDDEEDDDDDDDDGGVPFEELEHLVGEDGSDEEIDSDEAFGESDHEKEWAKFKFRGSKTTSNGKPPKKGAKVTESNSGSDSEGDEDEDDISGLSELEGNDVSDEEDEEDDIDPESESDSGSNSSNDARAELRKTISEDPGFSDDESDSDSDPSDHIRAQLRKAIAADPTIGATPTTTSTSDVEKGIAVRAQQTAFDNFLGGRVKLQKALIAANDLAFLEEQGKLDPSSAPADLWKDAEEAALNLWNAIAEIRTDLAPPTNSNKKRKAIQITQDTPLPTITTHMTTLHSTTSSWRATTLTKWTRQTHQSESTTSLSHRKSALSSSSEITTLSGLPPHLDTYIHPPGQPTQIHPRLISRAHLAKFCAPEYSGKGVVTSENIYDDSEFYTLLLNTLITQRNAHAEYNSNKNSSLAMQAKRALKSSGAGGGAKMRIDKETGQMVAVDTKASKGRRLRYGVHEKLVDFMPPVPEKAMGWWEERQVRDLFGSLLGKTVRGVRASDDEEEVDSDVDMGNNKDGGVFVDDGFRIFG